LGERPPNRGSTGNGSWEGTSGGSTSRDAPLLITRSGAGAARIAWIDGASSPCSIESTPTGTKHEARSTEHGARGSRISR
jgi:hypothetical protein